MRQKERGDHGLMDYGSVRIQYLACSLAGHDKDRVYAVTGREGEFYLLSDGTYRTLDHPKKKNAKHVQLIKKIPEECREWLNNISTDSDLVHALRIYRRNNRHLEGKYVETLEESRCQNLT